MDQGLSLHSTCMDIFSPLVASIFHWYLWMFMFNSPKLGLQSLRRCRHRVLKRDYVHEKKRRLPTAHAHHCLQINLKRALPTLPDEHLTSRSSYYHKAEDRCTARGKEQGSNMRTEGREDTKDTNINKKEASQFLLFACFFFTRTKKNLFSKAKKI